MKYLTLLIALFILSPGIRAQGDTLSTFDSLIVRSKVNFNIPDSLKEITLPYFHKIPHHKAFTDKSNSFQIRYFIRPLDTWVADFNIKSKKEQKSSMKPNDLCKSMMMLATLDASGNKTSDYQLPLYPELGKKVNNTDWEAITLVEVTYNEIEFKYCYINCFHKDDVADIYVYTLVKEREELMKLSPIVTASIKYK